MIKSKIAWLEFEWEAPTADNREREMLWATKHPQLVADELLWARAKLAGIERALKEDEEHE